jgi:hypothetical protein
MFFKNRLPGFSPDQLILILAIASAILTLCAWRFLQI